MRKPTIPRKCGQLEQTFTSDKLLLVTELLRPRLHFYIRSECSKRNDTLHLLIKKLIRLSTLKHKKDYQTRESKSERQTYEAEEQ